MKHEKVVYLRKDFNPRTGFTKHFIKTNAALQCEKIIVTETIHCSPEEKKEIEDRGFTFMVHPSSDDLIKLDPMYIEIHGGLLTVFTYLTYRSLFRRYPLVIYIHSMKFRISDLHYAKLKDLFLERKYTIDGAFLFNALMPLSLYLFIIRRLLGLKRVTFTIASQTQSKMYQEIFKKYGFQLHFIPSGADYSGVKEDRAKATGKIRICSFSRAQLVRGLDVLIDSMIQLAKEATLNLYVLPDISTHRVLRLAERESVKYKVKVHIGKTDIKTILNEHDIFVFFVRSLRVIPYQPLTVLEALHTGKPVITSEIPQMKELARTYQNLILVKDYKNPESVARTMSQVIEEYKVVPITHGEYEWNAIAAKQHAMIQGFLRMEDERQYIS